MGKIVKDVTFYIEIFQLLKTDGKENGRDFSAEVNFACRKYLESKK